VKLLPATLDAMVVTRPQAVQPHLCADAGYKGQCAHEAIVARGYRPHVKQRREEAADRSAQRHPARRWVVERTHSWFNRFRKLLVSFEKSEASFVGLLSLAAALICWRQSISIYG
jgi:putative transposase